MGGMAGVGVAPPPNHPPTSLAGGSAPWPVGSVASLLRVCVTSSENGVVFSPGPGGRRRYICGVEGSIPLPGPPRWGSRPPRALRGIGLGRSRLARAVRRKRVVAAAAAVAAAAPIDDARGGALARPTSLCAAHAASSRASFVSISSPSHVWRSLALDRRSQARTRGRSVRWRWRQRRRRRRLMTRAMACAMKRTRAQHNRTYTAPPHAPLAVSISCPLYARRSVACSLSRARRPGTLSRRRRRRRRLMMRAVIRAHDRRHFARRVRHHRARHSFRSLPL